MPNTYDLNDRETQPPPASKDCAWPFLEAFALRDGERSTLVPGVEEQAMLEWECELG